MSSERKSWSADERSLAEHQLLMLAKWTVFVRLDEFIKDPCEHPECKRLAEAAMEFRKTAAEVVQIIDARKSSKGSA